jgi:hypothetical protein
LEDRDQPPQAADAIRQEEVERLLSTGGVLTGRGADIIAIDDPLRGL